MRPQLYIPRTAKTVNKNDFICKKCSGKNIIDIGLGGHVDNESLTIQALEKDPYQTLHGMLADKALSVIGMDINPLTVAHAQSTWQQNHYVCADIMEEGSVSTLGHFDIAVLGDVLEHLDNFNQTIQNLKSISDHIIITTVNTYNISAFIKMFWRYESVHEEHTCYFSYITLNRLMKMNGMKIEEFFFYNPHRSSFDSVFDRISNYFMQIVVKIFPQFSTGILLVAKKIR